MQKFRKEWPKFLVYALMLLGLCLLLYHYREFSDGFKEAWRFFGDKERVNRFILSFGPYAPLVFIGLQAMQVIVAPIPGEITGFLGGYVFGLLPGLVYSTVGLALGSLLAFLIGRRLGLPFVRRFLKQESFEKFEYLIERKGAFVSFLLFLIPGMPKDGLCYLLGLSPMHMGTFLLISTLGRLPGTLILTMQGNSIRSENYRAFLIVLGLAFVLIALTWAYRERIEKFLKK